MRIARLPLLLAVPALGASLIACGDDSNPPTDSGTDGMTVDSGMDDSSMEDTSMPPPPDVCESPMAVTGELGTVTVSGDTSMAASRPRDLGSDCGNPEAVRFAPQEVVAYTVPGSGEVGVAFTLETAGTDDEFAAIVQVRAACDMIPTGFCYGAQENQPNLPARGGVLAMGGDTIYFVVTGWSEAMSPNTDRGAWEMEITAGPNEAPTLVGGQLSKVGNALEVTLSTMDDMGTQSYRMELQTADGMGVDVNEDGMVNEADWFVAGFNEDPWMEMAFVGTDRWVNIYELLLDEAMVTQAEVAVRDVYNVESPPMTFVIGDAGAVGGACDDATYCAHELSCASMMCEASTEAVTACGMTTALTIDTPTDTTTSTTVSGTIPAGTGALDPGCTNAVGPEVVYTLTVPAGGTYDVIARTDLSGTGMTDTAIYLRGTCEDPTTELACNDDINLEAGTYSSRFELLDAPAGDHAIIVEQWFPIPTPDPGAFQMEVSLRPVLGAGADCDMSGADNRCGTGDCTGGTCP